MGYRSTFVTDGQDITLPPWFVEKWEACVFIREDFRLPIAAKREAKTYDLWKELIPDLQKVLEVVKKWTEHTIHLVWLHEDGKIDNLTIFSDHIENDKEQTIEW